MPDFGSSSAMVALQGLALLSGVVGAILNAKLKVSGFYFWLISNAVLLLLAMLHGLYGVAILQLFYAVTCIFGIRYWQQQPKIAHPSG